MIRTRAKVSEEINRNLPVKKTPVKLLALYTDPETHNAQRYRETDGQTDDMMMPVADPIGLAYCVAVRSAKKQTELKPVNRQISTVSKAGRSCIIIMMKAII